MTYTSLNHIVQSYINRKGYTKHWYFQSLKHASDCLREMHFDGMLTVRPKKIPVNAHNGVPLPCDFVELLKLGIAVGQLVRPLVPHSGINRLNAFDDSGEITTYTDSTSVSDLPVWGMGYVDIVSNDYGEHTGRMFGYKDAGLEDGYKLVREREEIQLSEKIVTDYVIMEYIGNGSHSDSATKVDALAQAPIEAYIDWQNDRLQAGNITSPKAMLFFGQMNKFRARKNPLTADAVKRIFNRSKSAAPKG